MRKNHTVLILCLVFTALLILFPGLCFGLDEADPTNENSDLILLKKLQIEGNEVTDTGYILSFITLKEGSSYEIDTLMDEINRSRENLQRTDLFSEIFFNDEFDEEENLLLTIELRERNYLFFGPGGHAGYEGNDFYFRNSLYVEYKNLFGNSTTIYCELGFYENQGLILLLQGGLKRIRYDLELEYEHRAATDLDSILFMPGLAYAVDKRLFIGADILVNNANYNSFALYPYLELGSNKRFSRDLKSWYLLKVTPYYGYNFQGLDSSGGAETPSSFHGIGARFGYYHDIFLKIVYQLKVDAEYQGGEVPPNLVLEPDVRGTRFDVRTGNKKLSMTNELHIPLPWEESLVIVPFIDLDVIGYTDVEVLLGGGVGVHWFNRFQDPLVVEIAFGRGFMLNFQKRL